LVVALLLLFGGAGVFAWQVGWLQWLVPTHDPNAVPRAITPRGDLAADEKSTIELFKAAAPSVVHITTLQSNRSFFNQEDVPSGMGSGFVWDDDGHIVTNAHVLLRADSAKVTLNDGTTLSASLTGAAPDYDLAVLKIDPPGKKAPKIILGTSKDLQVGQKTFAIGNPFGLDQSLTTGVISALGRQISSLKSQKIDNAIQTDAAINPGNSGGPLLDSSGRLIGVNTQIVSPSGAYAGIGFAIPVDTVNQIVPELIRHGRIVRPDIGAQFLSEASARQWGVQNGAVIKTVNPDGPADKAGLRSFRFITGTRATADIIVSVNGQPVKNPEDFLKMIAKLKVGDVVTLGVSRGSEELEIEVTLGSG
jgi:S1-C subfamily serine protease